MAPSTAHSFRSSWNTPTRIANSPTKPLPGIAGMPIDESIITMKKTAKTGITRHRPPNSLICRVCRRS